MKEEEQPKKGTITNNFYGPVGQVINNYDHKADGECSQSDCFPDLPTREEMIRAIKESVKQGLWWSNRSWAVVYRVWQMKGYMRGFTQFANEVNDWGLDIGFDCNYDAVQKPITSGALVGNPDIWIANGAQPQAVNLANALLELLSSESS